MKYDFANKMETHYITFDNVCIFIFIFIISYYRYSALFHL